MAKKLVNKEINLEGIREAILAKIIEKHGSVNEFSKTAMGMKIGKNLKTYLYPSGATSYPVLKQLCTYFGIGELKREVVVTRSILYSIDTIKPVTEKNA